MKRQSHRATKFSFKLHFIAQWLCAFVTLLPYRLSYFAFISIKGIITSSSDTPPCWKVSRYKLTY